MNKSNSRLASLYPTLAWLITFAATSAARAEAPSSSASASSSGSDVTTLEKYDVEGVPISQQILPTARPIGSVMGAPESILDIPRSITSVNEEWMKERSIRDTMDLGQFSPGVYSPSEYGLACIPQIRGQLAEIYVGGQTTNFNYDN